MVYFETRHHYYMRWNRKRERERETDRQTDREGEKRERKRERDSPHKKDKSTKRARARGGCTFHAPTHTH